eukprot:s33_g11.t1
MGALRALDALLVFPNLSSKWKNVTLDAATACHFQITVHHSTLPQPVMTFRIPWRLLIPPGSVDTAIGTDGGLSLAQKTGAKVTVSTSEEAPVTLSDKIVKIEGSVGEQEEVLGHIVAELFEFQGTLEDEDGLCVFVMPTSAVGAVIGAKGSKISEIMSESGAEIDVGRECIIGMPDNPVVLRGRPGQIVRAAVLCNAVLQDLADKGRVQADDFCYIPGRAATATRTGRVGASSSSLSCARFLVEKDFAGFLIGKGGDKIKRLRDQTGATLQFRGPAEEVTLILGQDQRVLDIRGSTDERNEAIRACFVEMDAASMSSTRLLLPLACPEVPLQEAAKAAGASIEMLDDIASPESSERVLLLGGDSSIRMAAVLALVTKADAYSTNAPVTQANQANQANQVKTNQTQTDQAMPKPSSLNGESRQSQGQSPVVPSVDVEKKLEPESGKVFTFQEFRVAFAKEYSEKDIADYWRDACQPVPEHLKGRDEASAQATPAQRGDFEREQTHNKDDKNDKAGNTHVPEIPKVETKEATSVRQIHSMPEAAPVARPSNGDIKVAAERQHFPRAENTKEGLGALLKDSPLSELHLLLPSRLVRGPLVAYGQLADIAVGCSVEIHVGTEVSPGQVQVTLNGTCAAIAMATLALQMRICFAQGS